MKKILLAGWLTGLPVFLFTQAVMKAEEVKHNFGFAHEGEILSHEYPFENTGTEPLIISEYKTACTCTKAEFPKIPVKPGEKGVIKVTFDTHAKYDRQDRTVDIISNARNSPVQLRFKAIVLKKKSKEK